MRIGQPVGYWPANDVQFYIYFCDDHLDNQEVMMNPDEFIEYQWLSPDRAVYL